jgi:hypothetical protein
MLNSCLFGAHRAPATTISFLSAISANPATIRIDNFEFQFNTSERTADDKYDRNSFRMAPSFGQSQYVTPTFAVLFLAEQPGEQSDVHEKCKEELVASVQ